MIRLLNLGPTKHEKVAIYAVNQRISNVYRIAGAALQRSNPGMKIKCSAVFAEHLKFRECRL